MKFYMVNWNKLKAEVYNEKAELVKKLNLKDLSVLSDEDHVGIICHGITEGKSVLNLATGTGGRITKDKFFLLIENRPLFRNMFLDALKKRIYFLTEGMVSITDPQDIKRRGALIKSLIEVYNAEKEAGGRFEEIKFNTFLTQDKLQALRGKGKRTQ